jgi:hypothetical protein
LFFAKDVDVKNASLTNTICSLYPVPPTDAEANDAANNLLSFMELLIEIDMEHGITSANGCEVQP